MYSLVTRCEDREKTDEGVWAFAFLVLCSGSKQAQDQNKGASLLHQLTLSLTHNKYCELSYSDSGKHMTYVALLSITVIDKRTAMALHSADVHVSVQANALCCCPLLSPLAEWPHAD